MFLQFIKIQIPVGMMYHCYRRGKGIHVRGGKLKNVLMRTDCPYHRMLTKCVQELFSEEEQESNDFYIADSRGVAIWNGDKIEVDVEGTAKQDKQHRNVIGHWRST